MLRAVLALGCLLVVACGGRSREAPRADGSTTTGAPTPEFPCGDPSRWRGEYWCWAAGRDALVPSETGTEWELDAHDCGPAEAYDWLSIPECGGSPHCEVATPDIDEPDTCCFRYEIACKV